MKRKNITALYSVGGWMLLALALLSVNGVHAANTLQLSSVKGHPGDTVTLSLSLANSDAVVAMQAMVPLGKQLIYLPNSCLLTARGASHQVTAVVLRDTLRIYSYSLSLAPYSGNSGILLNFKVILGKEPGDYSLPLNKLLLSSAAGASLTATATAGKVTILAPKITLVSNSIDYGHVPIRSVYQRNVTVRNSGNEPLTLSGISFSDSSLSANYVSQVINAGGQATLTLQYAPLLAGAVKYRAVIRSNARVGDSVVNITADPFAVNELRPLNVYGYTDSVVTVELRMNNMDSIVALQTSIKLPQALAYVVGSFAVDSMRSHGHIATAGLCGDTLTLLVTSLNNNPLHGGDGVVARFKLRLHGYGGYALQLIGTMLGDSSGHNVLSAVYTGNVNIYSPYLSCGGTLDLGRSPVTDTVSAKLPIYNSGNAPLVIDRAFFTQGNWHFTNKLPMKIGNYRYDTLQVVCTDTTEGIHTTELLLYTNDPRNELKRISLMAERFEPNHLYLTGRNITSPDTMDVRLVLDNYSAVTALQMDIVYPYQHLSLTANNISLESRASSHMISAFKQNDSTLRLLILNMQNVPFAGHSGAVATLRLLSLGTGQNQTYQIKIREVVSACTDGKDRLSRIDSVVMLYPPVYSSVTDTACEQFIWNGKKYTSSGDYINSIFDVNGRLQVDTLHLTVHHPVHVAKTDTACETYTWNGKAYTVSGDYTYKHLDSNGCTQVDTLHLTVHHPVHVAKTDTACETYTWNGKAYTTSGDYTYKHLDANGCTQVDTLHLTVNHPVHVSKIDTACETYTWNGKVYTASGDYTYKHLDANGCTQVDTLHLTVNHPVHVAKTDTACETYIWNGKAYTVSGDYTYTHLDSNGCTQVDTLHLTVNHPMHVAKTDTACETYTWNGKVYTISGDYTYKHLDVNGCTQVDTLHLTVNHPVHVSKTDTACETYTWNGKVYTASGDYTYKHLDANGCTQVDTLHLTVHHPVHVAKTDTACETYTWNGKVYTVSGDYTYKHLDSNGCTQVDTLHLTVNHPIHVAKTDTACETYTWNGKVYTVSGDYTYKHLDGNGCTQVDTLHLTVHYNSVRNDTVEVCDRYTWHDSTYTESGVHQWHGFTVAGCDSTITLHLTINYSADTTITDTADNSYTWHDSVYTESGTYQWKGSTVAGCDSTVTLMLVIRHVGIEMIDGNGKKVRVYPNPTDGWLTIDADNIQSIEVYDNTGRRVAEYVSTNRIDLSHLPLGGYVLKIRMEKGVSIHHVIRN